VTSQNMTRVRIKGTKIKGRENPEQEPNFYTMVRFVCSGNTFCLFIIIRVLPHTQVCCS
jgi:hypothetical protein